MVTGPGDALAATAGRGRLRVSHAEREQVIDTLKTTFAAGRLAKEEFDLRLSQAFVSRTYADLAAVTAGLTPEPTAVQPPRTAQTPVVIMQRPGRMMAAATALCAGVWAFVFLLPWPRNSEGDPPRPLISLFFLANFAYLFAVIIGLLGVVALWHARRSGGQLPRQPSAGPGAQLSPGGVERGRVTRSTRALRMKDLILLNARVFSPFRLAALGLGRDGRGGEPGLARLDDEGVVE
jgi:hypothetical protein